MIINQRRHKSIGHDRMWTLGAFADEIAPELEAPIAVQYEDGRCRSVASAWETGDLALRDEIKVRRTVRTLAGHGIPRQAPAVLDTPFLVRVHFTLEARYCVAVPGLIYSSPCGRMTKPASR